MRRIENSIGELAPTGVPVRPLSEIVRYVRGVIYSKSDEQPDGSVKVLRSNNITLTSNTVNFDAVRLVSSTVKVRADQYLRQNDILISAASGSKAHVGKVAFIKKDIDYVFGGFMAVIRANKDIESRFLFHLLLGATFSNYLDATLTSSTINNLTSTILGNFAVPVPPLVMQREIVSILDTFTDLEAALEEELVARRRQYEHNSHDLLSFKPGTVEKRPLGELCLIRAGSNINKTKIASNPGPYPVLNSGAQPLDYFANFNTENEPIGIASRGSVGLVSWTAGRYFRGNLNYGITPNDESALDQRFLYHYFLHAKTQIEELCTFQGIPALNKSNLAKLMIPLPALSTQLEIARTLDLYMEIEGELEAELKARHQQYEHYRNQLLTFKELVA